MYTLTVENLARFFGPRLVFKEVSFSLSSGQSLAVTGRNGSGKTTLLRLLAGLSSPSKGKISFSRDGQKLTRAEYRRSTSYVGPELTLYDNLTAVENLRFFATMRGVELDANSIERILADVQLAGRGGDFYGAYSSGMKLRLKYAVALLGDPALLLLDEPTSNLDEDGKRIVSEIIARQTATGILIIATNEKEEYGFAQKLYRVGD
jgi:heme exporter protein A